MKDMTEGSVTRHLLEMSAFIAVSMLIQTLYLLADLYWVGSLGKEAIAAVGLAGNLMMVVLALTQFSLSEANVVLDQASWAVWSARVPIIKIGIAWAIGAAWLLRADLARRFASPQPADY